VYPGKRLDSSDVRKPRRDEVVELPDELVGLLRRVVGESLPELARRVEEGHDGRSG
jgi:hypothetical protein